MKKIMMFAMLCCFGAANSFGASVRDVSLDKGLGFLAYVVIGIGATTSLTCIISGGVLMGSDAQKGKMLIAGGLAIPVLMAVVWYIFENVMGIKLDLSSSL